MVETLRAGQYRQAARGLRRRSVRRQSASRAGQPHRPSQAQRSFTPALCPLHFEVVPTACPRERTTTVNSGATAPGRRHRHDESPQVTLHVVVGAPSLPKLRVRVRFSSPAPWRRPRSSTRASLLCAVIYCRVPDSCQNVDRRGRLSAVLARPQHPGMPSVLWRRGRLRLPTLRRLGGADRSARLSRRTGRRGPSCLEGGTGSGGQGVSGVAEVVVEPEALRHADDLTGLPPLPAEGAAPEGRPLVPHEEQPVKARLGVRLQVPAELPAEERGKNHSPRSCLALCRPGRVARSSAPIRRDEAGSCGRQAVRDAGPARDARLGVLPGQGHRRQGHQRHPGR